MRHQSARQTGEPGGEGERHGLRARQVNAHALGGNFRIAHRHEGAAGGAAQEIRSAPEPGRQHGQAQIVEHHAVGDRHPQQHRLRHMHAAHAAGDGIPALHPERHHALERQGGDGEVHAGHAPGGKAHHGAGRGGKQRRGRQRQRKRHSAGQQRGVAERADGEKSGMPQADKPGVANQQHHADAGDAPDEHHRRFANVEVGHQPRRNHHCQAKQRIPKPLSVVAEQIHVLGVAGCQDEAHALTPSSSAATRKSLRDARTT